MSNRLFKITPETGDEELALIIAEVFMGRAAPEHLSTEAALAMLSEADAEFSNRARAAGKLMHQIIRAAIDSAMRGETRH